MSDKVLGFLPKNTANVLLGALIVTVVLSVIWSYLYEVDFVADNSIVSLIVWLILGALVGWAVGYFAGNANASTLWIAAAFAWLAHVFSSSAVGADFMDRFSAPLGNEAFGLSVSVGAVVLAIVAAAFASIGGKK